MEPTSTPIEGQPRATRDRILRALRRSMGLSADQLAECLGVTAMAVRKHLAALEREGLLTSTIERRPIGRPVHLHALTQRGRESFPQHYQDLTTDLLDDLRALDGEEKVGLLFQRRAERAYRTLAPGLAGRALPEQLNRLAGFLDAQGYVAEWEIAPNGDYLLKEHHCAIYGVAQCAPEACECELNLFQRLLEGVEVARDQHVIGGDRICCYRIRPRGVVGAP